MAAAGVAAVAVAVAAVPGVPPDRAVRRGVAAVAAVARGVVRWVNEVSGVVRPRTRPRKDEAVAVSRMRADRLLRAMTLEERRGTDVVLVAVVAVGRRHAGYEGARSRRAVAMAVVVVVVVVVDEEGAGAVDAAIEGLMGDHPEAL